MISSFWREHVKTIDPMRFRASPHFLDSRGYPHGPMADYAIGLLEDHKNPLSRMTVEDGLFGAEVVQTHSDKRPGQVYPVSRDLLDSIVELDVLTRILGVDVSRAFVVDIGAGYGRFAHRLLECFPRAIVHCVDPVVESIAICRRYLDARGVARAAVGHFPPVADLAVNIHSWSECTREGVRHWLEQLARIRCPRIFIVPHNDTLGVWDDEKGGGCGSSYRPDLEEFGYREAARWDGPTCWPRAFFLFERRAT